MKTFYYSENKYMLTVYEASRVLGVSTSTVYKLIMNKELGCIKISKRKTVITAEELERYISEHK